MKAILIIDEMPISCNKCEVRCDGYTAKEYSEKGIKRPSWCPLKPMPSKKVPVFDPNSASYDEENEKRIIYEINGWNACIDELEG